MGGDIRKMKLTKFRRYNFIRSSYFKPLNAELNPVRHLLALVGARHFVHVSRVRVITVSFLTRKPGYGRYYAGCFVQANTGETPVGLCVDNPQCLVVRDGFAQRVSEQRLCLEGMVVRLKIFNYGFRIALFSINERFANIELFYEI